MSVVDALEQRKLFTADPVAMTTANAHAMGAGCACSICSALSNLAAQTVSATPQPSSGSLSASTPAAVPALNSRPAASAKLFLDFDGEVSADGRVTPAFDLNGNSSFHTAEEAAAITEIWSRVSEMYSPFNLDVTTVDPGNREDYQTMAVVLGGDGAWAGGVGGTAHTGGFSLPYASNTAYVFPSQLANNVKIIAVAAAHEAGHGFKLDHQSVWSGSTRTQDYNPGTASAAPIMGLAYYSTRGLWWNGTRSLTPSPLQDDVSVIASATNQFGLRTDDFAGTTSAATTLPNSLAVSGVITSISDADYFRFTTSAGTVSFTANVAEYAAMLDLKLELRDSTGTLVAFSNTASLGETLSATVAAGTYYVVVASAGNYGDLGQYSLSGNLPATGTLSVDAGSGYVAAEGGTIALAATVLGGAASSFAWDLDGDGVFGETGSSATRGSETGASVNFNAAGLDGPTTHSVQVRATAADGSVSTDSATVSITNGVPTIPSSAAPSSTVYEGGTLTLSFSAYDPGTDTISSWVINWGDGTSSSLAGTATSATKVYADNGTYTITLTATDEDGSYSTTRSVAISNAAPSLSLTTPATLSEGSAATFTFGATDPGADTITQWLINWGNGTTSTYAGAISSASKTYADNGTYTVTLTATDEDGSYSITRSITVLNVAPALTLSAPATANEGSSFSLSFSRTDVGLDTVTGWIVAWGDGTTSTLAAAATSASKTYADNGTYTIALTAVDEDGSYSASRSISIANVAPTLNFAGAATANEGATTPFTFSAADAGQDTISAWAISWGDGTTSNLTGSASSASKAYADNGTYTVTLTATDEDGTYTAATRTIVVANVSTSISISALPPIYEGSPLTINWSALDAGQDTISSWLIQWGDGTTTALAANARSATKTYADNGTYTINVISTDEDGTSSASASAVVQNVAPAITWSPATSVAQATPFSFTWSTTDAGTDAFTGWTVNWGDGTTTSLAGSARTASKTYLTTGTRTVTLTGTDEDGSYVRTSTITVIANAPILNVTPSATVIDEGGTLSLLFASPNRAGSLAGWRINWGDGTIVSLAADASSASHQYADDGSFTISVIAIEPSAVETTSTLALTVNNVPPVLTLTSTTEWINEGASFTLAASGPSPDGPIADWTVDWGDGTTTTFAGDVRSFTNVYAEQGTYQPTVTATTSNGTQLVMSAPAVSVLALPTATITVPTLTTKTWQFEVEVTYQTPSTFDVTAFNRRDILVGGLGDGVTVKLRSTSTTDGGHTWVVRYSVSRTTPWDFHDNGEGTIGLRSGAGPDQLGRSSQGSPRPVVLAIKPPDLAGNSTSSPRQLGEFAVGKVKNMTDAVGPFDGNDFYRLKLTKASRLNIKLSDLSSKADVKVLNGQGLELGSSRRGGASSEYMSMDLPGGWYFVRVYDARGTGTTYSLRVEAAAPVIATRSVFSSRAISTPKTAESVSRDILLRHDLFRSSSGRIASDLFR